MSDLRPRRNQRLKTIQYSYLHKNDSMKNADKPFLGIMVASIAVLYTVIAILS